MSLYCRSWALSWLSEVKGLAEQPDHLWSCDTVPLLCGSLAACQRTRDWQSYLSISDLVTLSLYSRSWAACQRTRDWQSCLSISTCLLTMMIWSCWMGSPRATWSTTTSCLTSTSRISSRYATKIALEIKRGLHDFTVDDYRHFMGGKTVWRSRDNTI